MAVQRENPGKEVDKALALQSAVHFIKHLSLTEYIPESCPPLALWGESLDQLLEKDDKTFLDEVTKVFNNFESLSASFYPLSKAENRFSFDGQSIDIDFNRLDNVYARILKISETENGVFEKIIEG